MIAPRLLPTLFRVWNRQHRAPFGRFENNERFKAALRRAVPDSVSTKLLGPFSIQTNSTLRRFEYPWALHAANLADGHRILEIGGGLSGFQFAVSRMGCHVVNVDPGMQSHGKGWPCDTAAISRLNGVFGTDVELRNVTVRDAQLEDNYYDRAFSISVLEHLPASDIEDVCLSVFRALKPGGLFVVTVDLFLDLHPFTAESRNRYGTNVSVAWIANIAPFLLISADKQELFGYPEFDVQRVHDSLGEYLVGSYPALAQCVVLKKPR